jgi:lipoprotein-anchoring transpeptidase ErfK/SrfK
LRSRFLIPVVAALATLVVLGGALLAFDQMRTDRIAKGVRVAGVGVGGLSRAQARAKLHREVLAGLQRPIVVHHGTRTWSLSADRARLAVDLDAMVDEAVARSRGGNFLTRDARALTGGGVDADLRPAVRYSDVAVVGLLDRVRGAIDRPAQDASVRYTATGLHARPSRDGLAVQASELHRQIRAAIVSPTAPHAFVARTRHTVPKVTTERLAARLPSAIVVDRSRFRLTLYKHLRPAETYSIAVGRVGLETPAGLYHIQDKVVNPAWHVPKSDWAGKLAGKVIPADDPANPIKARWMGIFDGAGIHGTDEINSIGSAASHGCIRMRIHDVERLYDEVSVGAPVYIA